MNKRFLHLSILLASFSRFASAQTPGPPANPEFFSAMSAVSQQVPLEAPPPSKPKGAVAELTWEEFHPDPSDSKKTPILEKRVIIRYSWKTRELERTELQAAGGGEGKTTFKYRNGRLQSETTQSSKSEEDSPPSWVRWGYDAKGRVIDVQNGSGTETQEHTFDYRYDPSGRPTEWTYHLRNEFVSVTKIKYTGNIVETSTLDERGEKTSEVLQTVDSAGRVIDLKVSEHTYKEPGLKLSYHVRFQFDSKGRVIIQETDPYDFEAGEDYQPFPGKLVVRYDDATHTREQLFYDSNGALAFRNLAELDPDGVVCSLRVFDGAGKERQEGELLPKAGSLLPESRPGITRWEVDYDKHGNWTERRRYFYPAAGGDRMLMQLARQTIRYR